MARITAFNVIRSADWGGDITCCCCTSPEREVNLKDLYTELPSNIWVCESCSKEIEHERRSVQRRRHDEGEEYGIAEVEAEIFLTGIL